MRVLLGTIIAGTAKSYAVAKFEEMRDALFPDVVTVAVVDQPGRTSLPEIVDERMAGSPWATEIVYYGKQTLKEHALTGNFDALVWQGIDCYYTCRADFDQLLQDAVARPIVGGLVAGRNRENLAVCREFVRDQDGFWSREQKPSLAPDHALRGLYPVPGYIGSDATVIRRDALYVVTMDGYEHWHLQPQDPEAGARGWGILGPEEFFMWSAVARHGMVPAIDTRVRPWHLHENLRAVRYPGEVCHRDELHWERALTP